MYFDMPLEELQVYRPQRDEPVDFDEFWQATLAESRTSPLNAVFEPVDFGLKTVDTLDISFSGYAGQTIKSWLLIPKKISSPTPCVITYVGYGGGRSFPTDWLVWSAAGFAEFVMDTRGQGSAWVKGDTPDLPVEGSSAHYPGFMTMGILDPKTYYYRRLFTDAVRAVEATRAHPLIAKHQVAVSGSSQGGGLSIAVGGLVPDLMAVMPDVPFLCNFRRAVTLTDESPYYEIQHYCKIHRDQVATAFHTLSYFDGMHFATRANAPALFSTGLMDVICPPSTVFAAYNYYAGKKKINVYHFNQHDGGGSYQVLEKIKFLQSLV